MDASDSSIPWRHVFAYMYKGKHKSIIALKIRFLTFVTLFIATFSVAKKAEMCEYLANDGC